MIAQPDVLGPLPEEAVEPPGTATPTRLILQEILVAVAMAATALVIGYGIGRVHGTPLRASR